MFFCDGPPDRSNHRQIIEKEMKRLEKMRQEGMIVEKITDRTSLENLRKAIEQWFYDRNLVAGSTAFKQFKKTEEEIDELYQAIVDNDREGVKDGIGDVVVTLIGIGLQYNLSLTECVEHAYNEIKDRKGKMIDGIFVKEEDLKDEE